MAGHYLEILISGQRLEAQKASVFARLEVREPPGMQLIIGRAADALTSATTSWSNSASHTRVRCSSHGAD
jgi:hypothetical protein